MNRIERIEAYEKLFDEVRSAVDAAREALNALEELRPAAERLREYYTGRQWKKDFADDETGMLPQGLKRGVLSEDGIDHLLDDYDELTSTE